MGTVETTAASDGAPTRAVARPATLLLLLAALVAASVLGRLTRPADSELSLVWPAAGVAVVALAVLRGTRWYLPGAVLVAGVVGAVIAVTGMRTDLSLVLGVLNAAQALAVVEVYARRPGGDGATGLRRTRDLWWFTAAAALAAGAAGALLALTAVVLGASGDVAGAASTAAQYWVRHLVSLVVVVPLALRLLARSRPREHGAAGRRERALMALAFAASYADVFWFAAGDLLPFALLPVSVWHALRRSTTAVAGHVIVSAAVVIAATLVRSGPFADLPTPEAVVQAQCFIAVVALLSLVLALHRDEREDALAAHRREHALLEAVFAATGTGLDVYDAAGRALRRNPASEALVGSVSGEVPMARWSEHYRFSRLDGSPLDAAELPVARALAGESVDGVDVRVERPGGEPAVLSVAARPLPPDADGTPSGAVAAYVDVSAAREAAAELARARDLLAGVLDGATEQSIIGADATGVVTVVNAGAERMLGCGREQLLGRPLVELHDAAELARRARALALPDDAAPLEALVSVARSRRHETRRWTYRRADASTLQVQLTTTAVRDDAGAPTSFICVATDVTGRLEAERRLADSEQLFRLGFEVAPSAMLLASLDPAAPGRLLRVNRSACALTGRHEEDLLGRDLLELLHPDDRDGPLQDLLAGTEERVRCERRVLRADSTSRWGSVSAAVVRPVAGDPYLVCLVEDVTAQREAEARLSHQARHDALTGLANRLLLRERLEAVAGGGARALGLLYLDLDGFKAVNDAHGHPAGDELLQHVARRLRGCLGPDDVVARLGGDEFAALCSAAGPARDLEELARRVVEELARPVHLEGAGVQVVVGASVGVRPAGDGASADDLLRDADAAMYDAKRAGKGRARVRTGRAATDARPPTPRTAVGADTLLPH
ncbi:bifunctional diguanylate cyclase/phosphodiesterase [uncultured Pseudokineococcus sp.]|uniref:sensor domain-containing protein n=1 Tax=uncultured Pseudokineococcus sp. TaxID=1642928 RepID=UPI0026326E9A|nr:diguanylate cyclase [uncultured Pseudokineococcus sp.]